MFGFDFIHGRIISDRTGLGDKLWVVWKWASRLYGGRAGWVAAVLWIFNPDIIANSAVVAPDLPATASGLLAGYVFWSWLIQRKRPFPWSVFNPLAGGPNNGWRYLSHSNVDWGQSTYRMVDWVKSHPEQRPMTVLFRSSLGSPEKLMADEPGVFTSVDWYYRPEQKIFIPQRSGWYLISSYQMTLEKNRYFWDKTPVQQPFPDVLLFRSTDDLRSPSSE